MDKNAASLPEAKEIPVSNIDNLRKHFWEKPILLSLDLSLTEGKSTSISDGQSQYGDS